METNKQNTFVSFIKPKPVLNSNSNNNKKVLSEVTSTNNNKPHQTTSTPCHEQSQPISNHHDYFTSLNATSSSLIGTGRLENIIDITNGANASRTNVPILGNNININNISNNTSNNNSTQDIISYQRVKKILIDPANSNEAQLKAKENMLNHLKSIDLAKYSFPNESSYLKECKEQANDNIEMPNLCRRARRSPQSLLNASSSSTTVSLLNKSDSIASTQPLDLIPNLNKSHSQTKSSSIYEKIKSFVLNRSDNQEVKQNSSSSSSSSLPRSYSMSSTKPLVRNLHAELEEEYSNSPIKQTNKLALNPQMTSQGAKLISEASATSSTYITANNQFLSTQTTTSNLTSSNLQPNGTPNLNLAKTKHRKSKIFLILLLLLPFLIFGLNKLDEKENIYEKINQDYIKKYLNLELNADTLNNLKQELKSTAQSLKYFFWQYLPDKFKNETKFYSQKTSDLLNEIRDFKASNLVGFDLSENKDLVKSLEEIKEKVLTETISNFKNAKLIDIEMIKKELDQKFNYTLTIMSNKLADQLSQFEVSKNSYESELKKVKDVLNEMDSRYSILINQMQEQKKLHEQLKSTQSKEEVKQSLKETFSGEYISFKKIEEYINRTFYVYNADKTGMTDFASESVGASILFTRCTEDYNDNSRWFTVFDVRITRITVSPRVVIQGSIQPGNCWAFKGAKADLFIKLAARITPTSFSLEHIPKELSLTGSIDSAPQNFTVYGYVSKDDISDETRLLLGNYRYDNESKNTLQFFSVQQQYLDKPISVIELKIESNAGNKDYTCLYKFRVHGKLFKLSNEVNNSQMEEDQQKSVEEKSSEQRKEFQEENFNRNEIN